MTETGRKHAAIANAASISGVSGNHSASNPGSLNFEIPVPAEIKANLIGRGEALLCDVPTGIGTGQSAIK